MGAVLTPDIYSDFHGWLAQHSGRQYELHDEHINSAFVKMLRTIGFEKGYVRGEGCYLWDAEGNKYLDLLTGWGVFAAGRKSSEGEGDIAAGDGKRGDAESCADGLLDFVGVGGGEVDEPHARVEPGVLHEFGYGDGGGGR